MSFEDILKDILPRPTRSIEGLLAFPRKPPEHTIRSLAYTGVKPWIGFYFDGSSNLVVTDGEHTTIGVGDSRPLFYWMSVTDVLSWIHDHGADPGWEMTGPEEHWFLFHLPAQELYIAPRDLAEKIVLQQTPHPE